MILVISDTHCYYNIVNKQIEYAEKTLGVSVSCVLHLGDLGVFKSKLHDFFVRKGGRFSRPLYFIEGNHEDFDAFSRLMEKYDGTYFTYLPRATVHTIEGYRFLSLGGSAYMDAMNTQHGAIITDYNINDCLAIAPESVDIILTHDCPVGIGVGNTRGLECFGTTGFPRSDELAAHFRPKLWLFGHHHKWHAYDDRTTSYYGLSGSWNGFALLGGGYHFQIVENTVPWEKTPFIDRILMKCRLINPDEPPQKPE
jgi:predicted phosphodiesterase